MPHLYTRTVDPYHVAGWPLVKRKSSLHLSACYKIIIRCRDVSQGSSKRGNAGIFDTGNTSLVNLTNIAKKGLKSVNYWIEWVWQNMRHFLFRLSFSEHRFRLSAYGKTTWEGDRPPDFWHVNLAWILIRSTWRLCHLLEQTQAQAQTVFWSIDIQIVYNNKNLIK